MSLITILTPMMDFNTNVNHAMLKLNVYGIIIIANVFENKKEITMQIIQVLKLGKICMID